MAAGGKAMLQDFNFHTHTSRCGHAVGTDEEYVRAAITAGYRRIGFSDHAPYKGSSIKGIRMDWDEIDAYIASISHLREKYRDQIEIHIGFESEFFPGLLDEKKELSEKVEYMLLGQHHNDPYTIAVDYFRENSEEDILVYAEQVCAGLDSGLFTYLCHPDVIMMKQRHFTPACERAAHMIGAKCAETNTPVEINLRGVQKGKKHIDDGMQYYYPNHDFWKILSQYHLNCVYGVDAHNPRDLLDLSLYDKAHDELKDLNLNFTDIII